MLYFHLHQFELIIFFLRLSRPKLKSYVRPLICFVQIRANRFGLCQCVTAAEFALNADVSTKLNGFRFVRHQCIFTISSSSQRRTPIEIGGFLGNCWSRFIDGSHTGQSNENEKKNAWNFIEKLEFISCKIQTDKQKNRI